MSFMNCTKCGKPLNKEDVYCFSCGTININNPKNKIIKDMVEDKNYQYDDKNTWYVKMNNFFNNSIWIFVIINVIGVLLSIPIFKYIFSSSYNVFFWDFIIIFNFYKFCIELLLKKANLPWWGLFIPIYDVYLLFRLAFGNGLSFIVLLIPFFLFMMADVFMFSFSSALVALGGVLNVIALVLCFIISLVVLFWIGKRFGRSGIITVLFFYVIIPSIAFNKNYKYTEPLNDKQ